MDSSMLPAPAVGIDEQTHAQSERPSGGLSALIRSIVTGINTALLYPSWHPLSSGQGDTDRLSGQSKPSAPESGSWRQLAVGSSSTDTQAPAWPRLQRKQPWRPRPSTTCSEPSVGY